MKHYENFPVASVVLPKRLRRPVGLIYAFARQADDFADEGMLSDDERITLLDGFRKEIDRISKGEKAQTAFFEALSTVIEDFGLPVSLFADLLDAFSQDVVKKSYANFSELLAYCEKSANPVGRLLLRLYGIDTEKNRILSDKICSSLQLINFLQDVAIDHAMGRIYLPADEMQRFGVDAIEYGKSWQALMTFQAARARAMMLEGVPLAKEMKGRLSFEMRLIILGGLRILEKLEKNRWDVFRNRWKLGRFDWLIMFLRAAFE